MLSIEFDRYASHIPALQALSRLLPMRRVLELGGGAYSTRFFLSLDDLTLLWTVETDEEWFEKCRDKDPRHALMFSNHVGDSLPALDNFDLVFIDDSGDAMERARSIHAVLSQPHPPTVIHDAEVPEYQAAIEESGCSHFVYEQFEPHTALVLP